MGGAGKRRCGAQRTCMGRLVLGPLPPNFGLDLINVMPPACRRCYFWPGPHQRGAPARNVPILGHFWAFSHVEGWGIACSARFRPRTVPTVHIYLPATSRAFGLARGALGVAPGAPAGPQEHPQCRVRGTAAEQRAEAASLFLMDLLVVPAGFEAACMGASHPPAQVGGPHSA